MRSSYFKLLFYFTLILLCNLSLFSQDYNQWIEHEKQYLKIGVNEDGIYRITYDELNDPSLGFNISIIDPKLLQMYYRGEEIAIFVSGEDDGFFNQGDYIEFIGKKNDGTLDTQMYDSPNAQTNPYHNLYSNTSYYFLTFSITNTILGKRIQTFTGIDTGQETEEYYINTEVQHFFAATTSDYTSRLTKFTSGPLFPTNTVELTQEGAIFSHWSVGKGHTDRPYTVLTPYVIGSETKIDYSIPVNNFYLGGVLPTLELRITGRNNTKHLVDIYIGPTLSNQRLLKKLEFYNYENEVYNTDLEVIDLNNNENDSIYLSIVINKATNDYDREEYVSVSAIKLTYAQTFNIDGSAGKRIELNKPASESSKLFIEDAPLGSRLYDITDETTPILIAPYSSGQTSLTSILPSLITEVNRKLYFESSIKSVNSIEQVPLFKIEPQNYNYIIITHHSLLEASQQYADYRQSTEGGSFNVLLADIDNLYAQFSYGEVTPLAIRKFAEFMIDGGDPEYLLLIGKGLDIENEFENNKPESNSWTFKNLIPCYGKPCSDNSFSSIGNPGTTAFFVPVIPTGRIPAMHSHQVINYLNKVKEHESFEYNDLWKKRILHLSGGQNDYELRTFKGYVDAFAEIASNNFLGGITKTITKATTNEVEEIDISEEVTNGIGLITFFGHSSPSSADIDFGKVSDPFEEFENKGKYPMLLVNGCNAGNIFSRNESIGEDWILTAEKGAILYLAHSHLGFHVNLNDFSNGLYKSLFSDSTLIHQSIGKILRQHYNNYLNNLIGNNNERSLTNSQQFVLQGDPAIRLYNIPNPDFFIDDDQVSINEHFLNERLSAQSDSFQLNVVISNFGRTTPQPIDIFIRRTFSNGSDTTYGPVEIPSPMFKDTISYVIYNSESDKSRGIGINNFEVFVDYQEKVNELNENNNYGQFNFFFPRGAMVFIAPKEYSIVNQQPVTLFAQNSDPTAKSRDYTFELDTSRSFDSDYKIAQIVRADLVPKWTTNLISDNETDSIVYYARVRLKDFTSLDDTVWSETSFLYKANSPNGWSQSHNEQLRQNALSNLSYDNELRRFKYKIDTINIKAKTVGFGLGDLRYSIELNGKQVVGNGQCNNFHPGELNQDIIMLIAFDHLTGIPYVTQKLEVAALPHGGIRGLYCGFGEPGIAAVLDTRFVKSPSNALNKFVDGHLNDNVFYEGVKDGDYILIVAAGGFDFDQIKDKIYQFEKFGVIGSNIEDLHDDYPYIAFGRKGFPPGTAEEITPDYNSNLSPIYQEIAGEFSFIIDHRNAIIVSPRIGPAKKWNTLYNFHQKETIEKTSDISLYGVKRDGESDLIIHNIVEEEIDLNSIQPNIYPYLRLQSNLYDSVSIPRQIDSWGITYEEVPEGILFLDSLTANLSADVSVQEGDSIQYFFKFENVTATDFEEKLIVNYTVQNLETQSKFNYSDTTEILAGNSTLKFTTKFPTVGFVGSNKFTVNINPLIQSEQVYDNNVITLNHNVEKDDTNPILDVVFDGTHILDGDIVAPNPLITITISDENEYLIREDTVGIKILIKDCKTCEFQRISFESSEVSYGRSKSNTFQIDYSPKNLEDNTYTLNVIAQDVSGNDSGIEPYEINFNVINESKITQFYPYPNPFSESVRFVFTLTGSVLPNQIKIQIMTVTGRVVREIMQDEIGPIKIGNNITQYAWDGKDEFGDQLANGVYLYRVIVKLDGEGFNRLETKGDKMFQKGFGKMYLLR